MTIRIEILKERCKGCGICVAVCQTEVLHLSEDTNEQGYKYPVAEKSDGCLLCGLCEMVCPDFAIWVRQEEEEANP
ncbi:MAG: 4Fe-4S binding protein [Candidatus Aminicenantes bacterium]|nr:4Fe-4S binding protein [Candidatus Aminicenantes bacterium]